MDIIVYIDIYFVINFCMDLIIVVIVSKMTQTKTTKLRYALGSCFGAALSCLLLINKSLPIIMRIGIGYFVAIIGMALIGFRFESIRKVFILALYMVGVAVVLGGILSFLLLNGTLAKYFNGLLGESSNSVSILMLIVAVVLVLLLLPYLIRYINTFRKRLNNIFDVSLVLEGRSVSAKALLDTGNHLREPLTNKPVIIVEKSLLKQIMTKGLLEYTTRIKVIPYRSIGKEHGTMYALLLDRLEVTVNNDVHTHEGVVACVYEGTLSSKRDYQLILHEELM